MVVQDSHGSVVDFVGDVGQFLWGEGVEGGSFGQVSADDAVPVLVAAPLPGAVGVGEVGEDAQGFQEVVVEAELGSVVHRDGLPGSLWQGREEGVLGPERVPSRLRGNQGRFEEPGPAFHFGVQAGFHGTRSDDGVGLPMPEPAPGLDGAGSGAHAHAQGNPRAFDSSARCLPAPPVGAGKELDQAQASCLRRIDPRVDRFRAAAHSGLIGVEEPEPAADHHGTPSLP